MRFLPFLSPLLGGILAAASHRGIVRFNGLPVPGASVTASQGAKNATAVTDERGEYVIDGLADGVWTVRAAMQLFERQQREIQVPTADAVVFDLTLAPLGHAVPPVKPYQRAEVNVEKTAAKEEGPGAAAAAELAQRAADGLLINGSVNNAASSPFAQLPAFGNNRRGQRSMYNGNLGVILNQAAFDARPFSLTGQATPKPDYSRVQAMLAFGGPLRIPRILDRGGPNVTVNYQWTRNRNGNTLTGLLPTIDGREGRFTGDARTATDPLTRTPFPGNVIPATRVSPQARALLDLYPIPNFTASSRYNYQIPVVSALHQDDLQSRANKQFRRNMINGTFNWQTVRTSNPDLFGFLETGSVSGINTSLNYRRSLNSRTFAGIGYQYSRMASDAVPFFARRRNVSAEAGIDGNDQAPVNWGPPALIFVSGICPMLQPQASTTKNQTSGVSADGFMSRGRHNVSIGGAHRRQQWNMLGQQDARGAFAFTGAAAGHDLAGFVLGIPDTASIAFGNADKYPRASISEGFVNDDWRVNPSLTVNAGVRWEYWSPVHEKYGRLVNLDIGPGFTTAVPSSAALRPDRNNIAPRIGVSWRPFAASSFVVRAGYGVYYDTSVYLPIAMQMAQQAPLSKSFRVANAGPALFTMANAFTTIPPIAVATVFGADPDFRMGYSQNWQVSLQRDLPAALQTTLVYAASKGTRAQQQILPNTFPDGIREPSGYTWLMSNGNASRHSAQIQLRRRLRSGFAGELQYTWAKAVDNAAAGGRNQGGSVIAQNWLDLRAERALANFDQRHNLTVSGQYTTGMGMRGGALAGWKGRLLKEWTFGSQIRAGSGLPLTPVFQSAVRGTGVTGSLRPDYTEASIYSAPAGLHLNPAAVAAPAPGRWGNAGRNSIRGPSQFVLNASLSRTFRSAERVSMDLRIDAANALNYVTFPSWNTVLGNAQFGLPMTANPMRTAQVTFRTRF